MKNKQNNEDVITMDIESEIRKIKQRNVRVELDKKWEGSWTRKLTICVLTFVVVLIYNLLVSRQVNIVLSSLVPVIGFFLSTLSLGYIRNIWEKKKGGKR